MDLRENRTKIFYFDQNWLVSVLNGFANQEVLCFPVNCEIPEDSIVEAVFTCWERRALGARIYHDSFPIVPAGQESPHVQQFIDSQMMRLKRLDDLFEPLTNESLMADSTKRLNDEIAEQARLAELRRKPQLRGTLDDRLQDESLTPSESWRDREPLL